MSGVYGALWKVRRIRVNRRGRLELWVRRRILRQRWAIFAEPITAAGMARFIGDPLDPITDEPWQEWAEPERDRWRAWVFPHLDQ